MVLFLCATSCHSFTKSAAHLLTVCTDTIDCIRCIRSCCSSNGISNARQMAFSICSVSLGLTSKASVSSTAAPAISLKTNTPGLSCLTATYSLATKFIPSRKGVTNAISAIKYIAANSSNEKP